jgi:tetratricopeptide (TPR) repeat protein
MSRTKKKQSMRASRRPASLWAVGLAAATVLVFGGIAATRWFHSRNEMARPAASTNAPASASVSPSNHITLSAPAPATPAELDDRVNELVNHGAEALEANKPGEALAAFDAARKLRDTDEDIHFNRGIALAQLGRPEEAEAAYKKALELFPDYAEARINLGNLLVNQGRIADGIKQLQVVVDSTPDVASAQNNLGSALARVGRFGEAKPHLERALKLQPDYPEAQFNLGNVLMQRGQAEQALTTFRELLAAHPDFQPAQMAIERAEKLKTNAPPKP